MLISDFKMGGGLIRAFKAAADILLPRSCIVCGRKLNLNERHLCLYCLSDLPLTMFWKMEHNPMADHFNEMIQRWIEDCGTYPSSDARPYLEKYAYASSLLFYDSNGQYRHLPYQIKYHGNIAVGKWIGRIMGQKLKEAPWISDVDTIIPVPLHWRRKWKRGYNQAEIIAESVAQCLGADLRTDILKRSKHTTTQTQLEAGDKEKNVAGAFGIKKKLTDISDIHHILLIDDVFTSGSTLCSCFIALRSIFPPEVRISVATIAYVPM